MTTPTTPTRKTNRWRGMWADALAVGLALAAVITGGALVATGHGEGPDGRQAGRTAIQQGTRAATPAPPTGQSRVLRPWTRRQVRAALMGPGQVGGGFWAARMRRDQLGLTEGRGLPGCHLRAVRVPGRFTQTFAARRQSGTRAWDGYYASGAAYPDPAAALRAWQLLRSKARACPARAYRPTGRAAATTTRWHVIIDKQHGWGWLRAVADVRHPSLRARRSVAHQVIDYVVIGNVVLVQAVHIWRTPRDSAAEVRSWAARLLQRTVARLADGCPSRTDAGDTDCGVPDEVT